MALLVVAGGISLLGVITIFVYSFMAYNSLVRIHRDVDRAWSNIDVLLKQRRDELSKLVDVVEQYQDYESELLNKIVEARTRLSEADSPKDAAKAEEFSEKVADSVRARAENYPDLKANANFSQLQDRIAELEEKIADRREYYNKTVNIHNTRINQIPHSFFASILGYDDIELFHVDEADKESVNIEEAMNDEKND